MKSLILAISLAFGSISVASATEYTNNSGAQGGSTTANTGSGSWGFAGITDVASGGQSLGQGASGSTSPGVAAVNQSSSGYMSEGSMISAGAVYWGAASGNSSGTNDMHQNATSSAVVVDAHFAAGWVGVSQNATQWEGQAAGVSAFGYASGNAYATQLQQAAQNSSGGAIAINWPAAGAGISASQGAVQQQATGTSVYSTNNGFATAGTQQVQSTHLDQTTSSGAVAF